MLLCGGFLPLAACAFRPHCGNDSAGTFPLAQDAAFGRVVVRDPRLREVIMTLSTKVGYVVTGLAFLFVGAITVGFF
jgi:hypothetical protein